MMSGRNERAAARLHYAHCSGCSEYNNHQLKVCPGKCGLLFHDDVECGLVGRPVITQHAGADCYDC